jgi:hypothetical protein
VAFLVPKSEPASRTHLGLIANSTPPDEAIQFARRVDAVHFAQAFLSPDIAWTFVTDGPAPKPAWFEGDPALMGCQLAAALDTELARTAAPPPVDWWNHRP